MRDELVFNDAREATFKRRPAVLIIGGYGKVGRHIAAHLHISDHGIRITIAGRNLKKARIAARRWGERARSLAVDAEDLAAVELAVQGASLLVLNTETCTDAVAQACIQNGVSMISVAASLSVLRSIAALDKVAQENIVTLVKDVGLAPGLIQILALHAIDQVAEPELVEFFLELGLISRHSREAIAWTLARIAEAQRVINIQRPDGSVRAIPIDFIDGADMAARLGSPQVKSYFVLVPRWTAAWLLRLAPALRKHADLVLTVSAFFSSVLSVFRLPNDQLNLHIWATSSGTRSVVSLRGHNQSKVTGVLAAETAMAILRDGGHPGVFIMSDVLAFGSLHKLLDNLGLVFEETIRHER